MGDDSGRDLHLPTDGSTTAAAIVLHPHPAMGGDRHHPLVVALARYGQGRRSVGLLVGLFMPLIGAIATCGIVLYSVGAVAVVMRARMCSHAVLLLW